MLSKIKNAIKPFLVHPVTTFLIVLTGIVNAVASIGMLAQQMGTNLGPLAPYFHQSDKVIVQCMVISAVCTALAGMGRSFISFVDNLEKENETQPK